MFTTNMMQFTITIANTKLEGTKTTKLESVEEVSKPHLNAVYFDIPFFLYKDHYKELLDECIGKRITVESYYLNEGKAIYHKGLVTEIADEKVKHEKEYMLKEDEKVVLDNYYSNYYVEFDITEDIMNFEEFLVKVESTVIENYFIIEQVTIEDYFKNFETVEK